MQPEKPRSKPKPEPEVPDEPCPHCGKAHSICCDDDWPGPPDPPGPPDDVRRFSSDCPKCGGEPIYRYDAAADLLYGVCACGYRWASVPKEPEPEPS